MCFSASFVLGTMGGSIFFFYYSNFLEQSYIVVLGIIFAAWFTKLPEWTTWTMFVALALYDLVA